MRRDDGSVRTRMLIAMSGYSDPELDEWAARMRGWAESGRDVYAYCDNDAKVRAPYDAMGLMRRLGLSGDAG